MTLADVPRPAVPRYKVTAPRRADATIERPRLSAVLDDAVASHAVTAVVAPAGFGKSTAVARWAARRPDVAWLSLDPYDADPRRLYRGVLAAFTSVLATDTLPPLLASLVRTDSHPRDVESAIDHLDGLLEALEEQRRPVVLVVDDAHHVPDAVGVPVVRAVLRARLPATRVLLLGRDASVLGSAGAVVAATAPDLAFTVDEIVAVSGFHPPGLTAAQAAAIHAETNGWPAAVRMSLVGRPDREAPGVGTSASLHGVGAREEAFGTYLDQEVLESLPPALATFVRRATTSSVVTPALAEALVGTDGPRLLAASVRRGLFLTSLGRRDDEDVYRWHDLVATWSRRRLARDDPAAARDLHARAARFWGPRQLAESVPHALAADDVASAVDLLVEGALEALLGGQAADLLELCETLPPAAREDARVVAVRAVAARTSGRRDEAPSLLARARGLLAADPLAAEGGTYELANALLETFGVERSTALDVADRLLSSPAAMQPAVRAGLLYQLGRRTTRRQQDPHLALRQLDECVELAERHGFDGVALAARAERASAFVDAADPVRAEQAITDVLARADATGWGHDARLALLRLEAGIFAYWRDELDLAQQHFTLVTRARGDDEAVATLGSMYGALASIAAGDAGGAAAAAQGVRVGLNGLSLDVIHGLLRMKTAQARGDVDAAAREAETLRHAPCMPFVVVWGAEALRVAGHAEHARKSLATLQAVPVRAHIRVAADLTSALLDAADGEDPAERIAAGLDVAAPMRFTHPYRERLPDLRPHLETLVEVGSRHSDFLHAVLGPPGEGRPPLRPSHWELTERELEILDGLRSSMTAAELAASLFVSVNTVKTHQRSVYRKLGARNRREAVRIAAQRGFLPS